MFTEQERHDLMFALKLSIRHCQERAAADDSEAATLPQGQAEYLRGLGMRWREQLPLA